MLARAADCRYVLVTRGNLGMALFGLDCRRRGTFVEASGSGQISDVCGAGDTAAAVFTLALAAGRSAPEAMVLANAAAGVVVLEHGAAVCSAEALEAALVGPAPSLERPADRGAELRRLGRCDQGTGRPCMPLTERAEIVEALRCVDAVTWFDEPDPVATLRELRPDVHAKGTDYIPQSIPEAAVDAELGIEIAICGDAKGHSTTELLARMDGT